MNVRRTTLGILAIACAVAFGGSLDLLADHPGDEILVDGSDTTSDVGGCGSSANPCNTLKAAIAHASAGDEIKIAPGTYAEAGQIVIDKDLEIEADDDDDPPVFVPTADTGTTGDARGWFLVNSGVTVEMKDLILDGAGFDIWQAIRSNGSGEFEDIEFRNIGFNPSGPDYAGTAIAFVGSGTGQVKECTFENIGRIGIHIFKTVTVEKCVYTGKGPGDHLDYMACIGGGASGTVTDSRVEGNRGEAMSDGSTSAGILVTSPGTTACIEDNDIKENTTGIVVGLGADASIEDNEISENDTGIVVGLGATASIEKNEICENETGILVGDDSADSSVVEIEKNEIEENTVDGINIITGAPGSRIEKNEIEKNGRYGLFLMANTSDVVKNEVEKNGEDGPVPAVVIMGNDNRIEKNKVKKNEGDGISLSGMDNRLEKNESNENDGDGFCVDASSSDNIFDKNEAKSNDGTGFKDQSTGGGTAGTANEYSKNECKKNDDDSDPDDLCDD